MKFCYIHPKRLGIHTCCDCAQGLCDECQTLIKGKVYCPVCSQTARPGIILPDHPRNLFIAIGLAVFFPGFGQVYNGQILKGIFIFLTFWCVVPWVYGIIDAAVVAVKINRGEVEANPSMVHLSGCFFLLFMFLFAPVLALTSFRQQVIHFFQEADRLQAEQNLRKIADAAEAYAAEYGIYPGKFSDLYFHEPPYIEDLVCEAEVAGYLYECTFLEDGYSITAAELQAEKPIIYTMSTGRVLSTATGPNRKKGGER